MKVGDAVPVQIGAATVANAKIVEMGDGTATLIIPATKVVMGVRTELETQKVPVQETNQHVVLGLENESGKDTPVNEAALNNEATEEDSSATLEALNPVVPNTDVVTSTPVEPSDTGGSGEGE